MTEPSFTRVGQTSLYWLDPSAPITGFWSSAPATLGPTPTLSQTWADPDGTYVYLGAAPADASAFAVALAAYLAQFRPTTAPRLLWIAAPDAPIVQWVVTELYAASGPAGWQIARRVDFAFAGYTLIVRGGATIAPGDAGDPGWGFLLGDPGSSLPASALVTPGAQLPARAGSTMLAMAGATAGCWRCALDLAASPGDAFAMLGCALQYFMPDPDDASAVLAIPFTALRQPAATPLALYATLDALRPFAGDRSSLGFFSWSGAGSPPALHSAFATARGFGIDLTPRLAGPGTPTPARLAFAFAPTGNNYLVPDGAYAITVLDPITPPSAEIARLLCGTSGLEYIGLPPGPASALVFVPNQPAFAPLDPQRIGALALTPAGTTAWAYVQSPTQAPLGYYAQPEDSPFFSAPTALRPRATPTDSVGFLDFLELIAAELPPPNGARAFPLAPYRDLDPALIANASRLEQLALAPRRRAAIDAIVGAHAADVAPAAPRTPSTELPTATIGVSPHGLAIGVAADDETWTWLGLAQNAGGPLPQPDLGFTLIQGEFQQAMLTNDLFMVLGNAGAFAPQGSVAYQLTAAAVQIIATTPIAKTWPPALIPAVQAYLAPLGYPPYAAQTLFDAALVAAYPAITADQQLVFRRYAGLLTPIIEGWTFRMSPDSWTDPTRIGETNAYVIFKFVLGRSLRDLAGDLSTWAWPAAASPTNDPVDAQTDILDIIARAVPHGELPPVGSPYRNFAQIVGDPYWTGILALSVDVPLQGLPPPLQVLAAGIDPRAFYAHHIGMSVTPFEVSNGALAFSRTSMFGLIDYENDQDQYFSSDIPFAFRVLRLTVEFENSVITSFTSRVELLVNRLFGSPTTLLPSNHGNNVILDGVYQQQVLADGTTHDAYTFSTRGPNLFQPADAVVESIELLSTQLVTSKAANPAAGDSTVSGTFQMMGNLRFYEPKDVDPFCWGVADDGTDGYLRFGNLAVTMTFALGDPAGTTVFTVQDGNLSFDLANSVARANSLVSRFPVRLTSLLATADPAAGQPAPPGPDDLGYVSVSLPLDQSLMATPWYGLHYTLDLGTLGALAGSTGLSIDLLAAWTPANETANAAATAAVYVGIKLPGTKEAFGVSLPLQGILQLGFRSIEIVVDNTTATRTYTLRLRDFAIRALGLAFPPGKNDLYLFGNPNATSATKIGWYAAYASEASDDLSRRRRLQATRAATRRPSKRRRSARRESDRCRR